MATECLALPGLENPIAESERTVAMLPPQLSLNRNPKKYSSGPKPPVFKSVAQNCYTSVIQKFFYLIKCCSLVTISS
jgi:hypothetical protein